jgi:hypothetical protein
MGCACAGAFSSRLLPRGNDRNDDRLRLLSERLDQRVLRRGSRLAIHVRQDRPIDIARADLLEKLAREIREARAVAIALPELRFSGSAFARGQWRPAGKHYARLAYSRRATSRFRQPPIV